MLPIMGGLALAVDFSGNEPAEAGDRQRARRRRHRHRPRQVVTGASDEALIAYANDFFKANLGRSIRPTPARPSSLPNNQSGGGTLKLCGGAELQALFPAGLLELIGKPDDERRRDITFAANSEIRLKNTLEVALVLDNSGSMSTNTAPARARSASTCSRRRPSSSSTRWRCRPRRSSRSTSRCSSRSFPSPPRSMSARRTPARHGWTSKACRRSISENFDWSTLDDPDKRAEKIGGIWYKKGAGWGERENGNAVAASRSTRT